MAAGDRYIQCDNPNVGVTELLNAISTKITATGTKGIRVYSQSIAKASLEPGTSCGVPNLDLEQWLRDHIVLDANDLPALHLITTT